MARQTQLGLVWREGRMGRCTAEGVVMVRTSFDMLSGCGLWTAGSKVHTWSRRQMGFDVRDATCERGAVRDQHE